MTRSRSSFDLSSAIAAAASLGTSLRARAEPTEATVSDLPPPFEGVALVSFKSRSSEADPGARGRTLPPIHGTATDRLEAIIRRSRERYGRPREEVEAKIERWFGG